MSKQFNTISIVGLGYIGLPTAAVIASRRVRVIGVDISQNIVDTINRGEIHIVEPGLEVLVRTSVKEGYLRATTSPEPADAFIIAVPTPFKDGYQPELDFIESASKSIAPLLKKGDLVVLESTSPVGATEQMAVWMAQARPDLTFPQNYGDESDIRVAHCPERVLPGHVLQELVHNDRVIGGMTSKCSEVAVSLYKAFVEGDCVVTNARTAEMAKLTENAFRDVNIAYANELSLICDRLGIDVWELIALANRHPRVNILSPGPGVGGHCIAVDPWFIVHAAPDQARLIRTARQVNDHKPEWVISCVHEAMEQARAELGRAPVVALLGLTFKANIDDLRESPSLDIAEQIIAQSTWKQLLVVEPYVLSLPPSLAGRDCVELTALDIALARADVIVLLVDHAPFKLVTRDQLVGKRVIDTRGVWR